MSCTARTARTIFHTILRESWSDILSAGKLQASGQHRNITETRCTQIFEKKSKRNLKIPGARFVTQILGVILQSLVTTATWASGIYTPLTQKNIHTCQYHWNLGT